MPGTRGKTIGADQEPHPSDTFIDDRMTAQLALKGGTPVRTRPFSQWPQAGAEERQLLLQALESGAWGFNGPREQEFSKRFAAYCGSPHVACVANGTVSLEIALRALGVGPGDEVIVPALTWLATAWAAVQVGATPVFADVSEVDWCLAPASFREKITSRTRAVIPVHLYSQMAEMDEILAIARERSIAVIEDCAHAHGSRWGERGAGTLGDIGSYSFQQSKAMTAGEGGALLTNDANLAGRIHNLRNCGRPSAPGSPAGFGGNYRITEFQAAILLAQLDRLESQLATKAANVALLRQHLARLPGISVLAPKSKVSRQGMYGLALRYDPDAFNGMPRELLLKALSAEGIPVQAPYEVVYGSPLWTGGERFLKCEPGVRVADRLGLNAHCPIAEHIAEQSGLVILHHVFLGSAEDMTDIATAIEKVQRCAHELRLDALQAKARSTARALLSKVGLRS